MKENNNGNDTNVGSMENSIKEDIEILVAFNLALSLQPISEDEFKDVQKAIKHILSNYKRVLEINEVLLKENEEIKNLMAHKNWYTQKLEEDLFDNASNYVISKQIIKDKIEELKKKKNGSLLSVYNVEINYCIRALQELLEESEE